MFGRKIIINIPPNVSSVRISEIPMEKYYLGPHLETSYFGPGPSGAIPDGSGGYVHDYKVGDYKPYNSQEDKDDT